MPISSKRRAPNEDQSLKYLLFSLTILDCGLVSIGNNVEIGPNVSIITGEHHTMIEARRANRGYEFTRSVSIGDDCWIGAGVIILAGVTIGTGCSIGAGAVVKSDIPAFSIAVGVPARVIRSAKQQSTVD
jgi:acetyltransferase-like isoleucine patch superfamily enzyme